MRYSLAELETFLAVMDHGTVTAAAARLNLSKSVVSKRISDLEKAIGGALFRRVAGRVMPTDVARELATRLRPALAGLHAATESAVTTQAGLRGRITLSVPMSFGTFVLGPILARFAAKHPELELDIDFDDRNRDLAAEGFDLGLRLGVLGDAALMARKLGEDRHIACASPAYLDRMGRPASPADLGRFEVISYHHRPDAQLWQFYDLGSWISPPVRRRVTLNNGEAMRDFAVAGVGLAMLPGFLVRPALADGRLEQILPEFPTRPLPVTVVWPPVSPMPQKLRAMIDHLAAELSV